jgi:hypothetical protein
MALIVSHAYCNRTALGPWALVLMSLIAAGAASRRLRKSIQK